MPGAAVQRAARKPFSITLGFWVAARTNNKKASAGDCQRPPHCYGTGQEQDYEQRCK
uniref:Uncharacterized protein n=1 Tax=Nymphaea colorata TaxID=210225 RepID=A0A5K1F9H3_9MAGN|nr:unnamed protein product [Nymphaea colorata]